MQKNYPDRRSIRLHGYDYSQEGMYFITICTHNRECLFGEIYSVGVGLCPVHLSPHGIIINKQWLDIPNRFPHTVLHEYIVMPNHFHAILQISDIVNPNIRTGQSPVPTLGDIIGAFKSITTKICNEVDNTPGRKIWQARFHDHIIRNQNTFGHITQYIMTNPARWYDDCYFEP